LTLTTVSRLGPFVWREAFRNAPVKIRHKLFLARRHFVNLSDLAPVDQTVQPIPEHDCSS
jgi:hypothetical protein